MDWKKKTVSMGLVKKEEFDLTLATLTVSENRVRVEPNDVEDWERIFDELGADTVLETVRWEDVEAVDKTVNELYYPHINITLEPDTDDNFDQPHEKRIFFTEDEQEELQRCFNTILRFWNKWRQHEALEDKRFPNEVETDEDLEEVELEDALRDHHKTELHEKMKKLKAAKKENEEIKPEQAEDSTARPGQNGNEEQEEGNGGAETVDTSAADSFEEGTEEQRSDKDDAETEDTEQDDADTEDDELDDIVDRFMDQD